MIRATPMIYETSISGIVKHGVSPTWLSFTVSGVPGPKGLPEGLGAVRRKETPKGRKNVFVWPKKDRNW